MVSYYDINREERLEYQKEYHALYHDKYVDYQKWYYFNVLRKKRQTVARVKKEVIKKEKKTKLTKTFLKQLERIYWKKYKDYNDTIEAEKEAKELSDNHKAFEGFSIVNGKFRLTFN